MAHAKTQQKTKESELKKSQPLFSPTESVTKRNTEIGNRTIHQAISDNHRELSNYIFHPLFENEDYTELLSKIEHAISDPALQAELQQDWEIKDNKCKPQSEIETFRYQFKYACMYVALAHAAEERAEHTKAWAFNNHASRLVGEVTKRAEVILDAVAREGISARNTKNGKGLLANYLPANEEAVRLLEEKPAGTWKGKNSAIKDLEELFSEFIDNLKGTRLTKNNIPGSLKNWMIRDPLVSNAWNTHKKQKKHKP